MRGHILAAMCMVGCSFSPIGAGGGGGDETGTGGGTTGATSNGGVGPGSAADDSATGGADSATSGAGSTSASDDSATGSADTGGSSGDTGSPAGWQTKHHIDWTPDALAIDAEDALPVLVRLSPSVVDYDAIAPGGADLRFRDESETQKLPYDIEYWNPGGVSLVWVLVPTKPAGSGPGFWMYYGNPDAPAADDAAAVWTGGPRPYEAVWHMTEDPTGSGPQFVDVTGNGHDGTAMGLDGASTTAVDQFGPAILFDGSGGQFIEIPDDDALTFADGFLVEALIELDETPNNQHRSAARKSNSWALNALAMGNANPRAVVFSPGGQFLQGDPVSTGVYYLAMHLSFDDMGMGTMRLFVNGMEYTMGGFNHPAESTDPVMLGWQLPGSLFEARVSGLPRRPRYVQLQWLGLQDALIEIGNAEPA